MCFFIPYWLCSKPRTKSTILSIFACFIYVKLDDRISYLFTRKIEDIWGCRIIDICKLVCLPERTNELDAGGQLNMEIEVSRSELDV